MAKSASGKYQGSLSLEWFNKQKAILLLGEEDAKKEGDIPAPRINWINRDDALFYEIDEEEGKGLSPYWVDRNDIRVKEARPLVFKKAYIAEARDKPGSLPGMDVEYKVKESKVDDPAIQNWLIKGDNLLALNALKRHFDKLPDTDRVKCIYIDPPYNTGSAFGSYDDNMEHSEWMTLLRDRLVILRGLLSESGSIWVHLDENETHYCKVLMDEIFGRDNFIATIIWKKSYAVKGNSEFISNAHESILLYCKNRDYFSLGMLPLTDDIIERYKNPDNDPRGRWQSVTMTISLLGGARGKQFAKTGHSENIYEVQSPSGRIFLPPANRCWSRSKEKFDELDRDGRIFWGKDGDSPPRMKTFLSEHGGTVIPTTLWDNGELFGYNQTAVREVRDVLDGEFFATPKPEKLIQKLLSLATAEGDVVLDVFLGSGTTCAVSQKMKRRWIGVEIGNHAITHIIPRLKKTLSGEDQGGISELVSWKGGGSFKYYELGPSIIHVDKKTGKGEFNWKLGREFLQESLLQSYDFVPDASIAFHQGLGGDAPAIGRLESAKGVIFGVAWLVAPDEPAVSIDAETVQALYNTLKQHAPRSIHVFTNKGWDIKQDAMPADMEIVKVPHAIFAELER